MDYRAGSNPKGVSMKSQSDNVGTSEVVGTEFDLATLVANAAIYHGAKRIMDAASGYDSLDDAKAALDLVWTTMERQVEEGGGFTPPVDAGFGSSSASVIGESILGQRQTVGATRKALNELGK